MADVGMGTRLWRLGLGIVGGGASGFILAQHGFSAPETVTIILGIGLLGGATWD